MLPIVEKYAIHLKEFKKHVDKIDWRYAWTVSQQYKYNTVLPATDNWKTLLKRAEPKVGPIVFKSAILFPFSYISNRVGVLKEAGTVYPLRVPCVTPDVWWGPCFSSCLVFFVLLRFFWFFFCLRPMSCVPYAAILSGLSILDCPFGFL